MNNVYSLSHSYSGMAIMRNYISIGNSSRFGLFNELQLSLGGGESKWYTGRENLSQEHSSVRSTSISE